MSPEFEQVTVRADELVISNAARFPDGTVFVPNCQMEEGDEIEVGGEPFQVIRCEPHDLRHRQGMLQETTGCLLTLKAMSR